MALEAKYRYLPYIILMIFAEHFTICLIVAVHSYCSWCAPYLTCGSDEIPEESSRRDNGVVESILNEISFQSEATYQSFLPVWNMYYLQEY